MTERRQPVASPTLWSDLTKMDVLDPDGWREDGKSWHEPVTVEEFRRRAGRSTLDAPNSIDRQRADAAISDQLVAAVNGDGDAMSTAAAVLEVLAEYFQVVDESRRGAEPTLRRLARKLRGEGQQ